MATAWSCRKPAISGEELRRTAGERRASGETSGERGAGERGVPGETESRKTLLLPARCTEPTGGDFGDNGEADGPRSGAKLTCSCGLGTLVERAPDDKWRCILERA